MKLLKKFGLVAAAALALTGIAGAASASAAGITADSYPATLRGAGVGYSYLKGYFPEAQCEAPELSGAIGGPTATVTVNPSNPKCFGSYYPLEMHGCTFTFHPGKESEEKFSGTFAIGGASCTNVELHSNNCTVRFGPQSGTATFANKVVEEGKPSEFEMQAQISNLKYTEEGSVCKPGTYENGTYSAGWRVFGEKSSGTAVGVKVASSYPVGVYKTGETFEAEAYPAALSGTQVKSLLFETKSGGVTCGSSVFGGTLTASSSLVSGGGAFSKCKASGVFEATVAMQSCYFTVHGSGTGDINCVIPGQAIDISVPIMGCHITVPAQTGLKGLEFQNQGSGSSRTVLVTAKVSGISYTVGSSCVGKAGSYTDGTLTGTMSVKGTKAFE